MYCDFGVKRERGGIASTQAALPKRSSTASDTLAPVSAQRNNGMARKAVSAGIRTCYYRACSGIVDC